MTGILLAAAIVGGTGLLLGFFLGAADEKFKIEIDEKEEKIRAELPGNNCGGCGYAGCAALAKAISQNEAESGACPVGGAAVANKIAAIMGTEAKVGETMTAFVKCAGTCEKTKDNYDYYGVKDCEMLGAVPSGGPKSCNYGCLGYGTCVQACSFDAIHIVDGIAVVDKEKCRACGKCISRCPKHLIELVPYEMEHLVQCASKAKGIDTMQACKAGCIGCKKCEKECPVDAITVTDNIAHIDYSKCANCGACALVCPKKVITNIPKKK